VLIVYLDAVQKDCYNINWSYEMLKELKEELKTIEEKLRELRGYL